MTNPGILPMQASPTKARLHSDCHNMSQPLFLNRGGFTRVDRCVTLCDRPAMPMRPKNDHLDLVVDHDERVVQYCNHKMRVFLVAIDSLLLQ